MNVLVIISSIMKEKKSNEITKTYIFVCRYQRKTKYKIFVCRYHSLEDSLVEYDTPPYPKPTPFYVHPMMSNRSLFLRYAQSNDAHYIIRLTTA